MEEVNSLPWQEGKLILKMKAEHLVSNYKCAIFACKLSFFYHQPHNSSHQTELFYTSHMSKIICQKILVLLIKYILYINIGPLF